LTSEDSLYAFLAHPLTGVTVTFVAALVCTLLARLEPHHRTFWEDAKDRPGQVVAGVTFGYSLAAALPRLVYDLPTATCEGGICRSVGGGERVVEGTGMGVFVEQFLLSLVLDIPAGLVGVAAGAGIAALLHAGRSKP
jgi:hypothetical protein